MNPYLVYLLLWFSIAANIVFATEFFTQKIEQKAEIIEAQIENEKTYFETPLFSDGFALKDYSGTKYTLEEEWKNIIKNAREFHSSPTIIKEENFDKYLCAGFLYELSAKFWDPSAPISIGMMDPVSKTAADAWELPYSYQYSGWELLVDVSKDFDVQEKNYWESIDAEMLQSFFKQSFSEQALLWDMWFLYKDTNYLASLQKYGYMNSHIVKNLWVSEFKKAIDFETSWLNRDEVFSKSFSCDLDIFMKLKPLLKNYEIYYKWKRIVLSDESFSYLNEDYSVWENVVFENLWEISLIDITMIHFFEWNRVDGLFEFSCNWDFFPVNVMSINPRLIEKM